MNFKKNGGFTLVELIVVIAILGLLAGIGIPQYSKYVEKAQVAVDNQNLNMLHNIFVVACVENETDPGSVTLSASNLLWEPSTKTFSGLQGAPGSRSDGQNPIVKSFNLYMGAPIQFKSEEITEADIIKGIEEGVETGNAGGSVKVEYTDKNGNKFEITLNQAQINALNGSTFMTNEALGVDGLTDKLDFVTGFATELFANGGNTSASLNAVKKSEDFQRAFNTYLGLDYDALKNDPTAYQAALKNKLDELGTDADTAMGNALVLYAANNTTMSKDAATALLGTANSNPKDTILATLNGSGNTTADPAAAMAQAALAYGMFTSYAYQSGNQTLIDAADSDNPLDVMNYLNDDGFKAYINDPNKGGKDLDGYFAAMGMITEGTQNSQVSTDVLTQGFNNTKLEGLLNNALGTTTN